MSTQQDINAFRAQRIANTHDPLALMANTQTPCHPDHSSLITYMQHPQPNNNFVSQPSFNTNYLQHPMQNPGDISNPTTAFNMALALMAKAFTLNDTTPTNNNQRSSSNPSSMQIAQPGMNMDQDRQMLMVEDNVGNQFRPNAMQNVGNQVVLNASQNPGVQNVGNQNGLSVVSEIANQHGDGNVVTAPAEGNGNGINGNTIRCYNCQGEDHYASNCTVKPRKLDAAYLQKQMQIAQKEEAGIQLTSEEFDFMAAVGACKETKRANANCTLENNLQQASSSGTQSDKAPVYDSDGSAEVHHSENCYNNDIFNMFTQEEQYTELLEPIPEPHQVQQNDSNVISVVSSVEQSGGTVEQHPANIEETRAYFESLYNNLATEVEKVNLVNLMFTGLTLDSDLLCIALEQEYFPSLSISFRTLGIIRFSHDTDDSYSAASCTWRWDFGQERCENPPPVTIHTRFERFNKQNPHSFDNAAAPKDAENRISQLEEILMFSRQGIAQFPDVAHNLEILQDQEDCDESERSGKKQDGSDNHRNNNQDSGNNDSRLVLYGCVNDRNMPNLKRIVYSDDDEEVGIEADMNNLATTIPISPIPTTRVRRQGSITLDTQLILEIYIQSSNQKE
ncbi:gag-pol polyprotein [Tanacetum coccineum]